MFRSPLPAKNREELAEAAARRVRGVTLAAVFDWGTAVFLVALLVITVALRGVASRQAAAAGVLVLVGVPSLVLLGEGVRRAREVARVLQLGLSSIVIFANAAGVLRDLGDLVRGEINPSTNFPSLIVNILIVWGLSRRQTISWFASTTPAEARRHFDRPWLVRTILVSVAVGIVAVLINVG